MGGGEHLAGFRQQALGSPSALHSKKNAPKLMGRLVTGLVQIRQVHASGLGKPQKDGASLHIDDRGHAEPALEDLVQANSSVVSGSGVHQNRHVHGAR